MSQTVLTLLLWFCAIGSGMIAGLFFAFSAFIMTSLARIPHEAGIAAMQSINKVIVKSLFMPVFFGTTFAGLLLAGAALFRWGEPGAMAMLTGGIVYAAGMFLCTVIFNVPLNNALAAADPGSAEAANVWSRYLKDWTTWNHLRTLASMIACGLFIAAIAAG
jgi:uncharacterized membrane protein